MTDEQTRSAVSFLMPKDVRRRIRTAAGMDDEVVTAWVIRTLDGAAIARIARGMDDESPTPPVATGGVGGLHCDEVIGKVAAYYRIPVSGLLSRSRMADVVGRRQVAIFLCSKFTGASATGIGHFFYRKHPAVGNAITVIRRAIEEPGVIQREVAELTEILETLKSEGGNDGRDVATNTRGRDRDRPEGDRPT